MSNSWSYTLVFRETDFISEEVFSASVETLNEFAYSFWMPSSKLITGMSYDGLSTFEFQDLATAQTALCTQGGSLTLWKDFGNDWYEDIGITFEPKSGEISIGVIHDLREDREEDVQMASDLKVVFIALCQRLEPLYGYSVDEYRLETILKGKDFAQEWANFKATAQNLKQPLILFWLNYFSPLYLHRMDEHSFRAIPHRKQNLAQGMLIYLAEHPWDAKMATLGGGGSYTVTSFGK